jgi:replicative DNA helicase
VGAGIPPQLSSHKVVQILVAKHRNGPTGQIRLGFLGEQTKFVNLATYGDEPTGGPPPDAGL